MPGRIPSPVNAALLTIPTLGLITAILALRHLVAVPGRTLERLALAGFALVVMLPSSKVVDTGLIPGGNRVLQAASLGLLLVATFASLSRSDLGRRAPVPAAVVAVLATAGVMVVVDIAAMPHLGIGTIMARLLAVAMVVVMVQLGARGVLDLQVTGQALIFSFGVICLMTAATADAVRACSKFKCGPFGGQITGPFYNETTFAGLALLALIFALFQPDRALRVAAFTTSAFVLYAAESRTSQIAAITALAFAALWRFAPATALPAIRTALLVAPASIALLGLHLVYGSETAAFSNRGSIWSAGVNALGDRWAWGRGLDSWNVLALDRNFMHSQYLLLLYSGGVLAVLFYCVAMMSILGRARTAQDWPAVAVTMALLVFGLVDIVWNPISIEHGAVMGLAILSALFASGQHAPAPAVRAGAPTPRRRPSLIASRGGAPVRDPYRGATLRTDG